MRTRHRADPRGAARAARLLRQGGALRREAAPRAAHHLRPRDDGADGLLQRHRELLAPPLGPQGGRAAAHAHRLLPEGLPPHPRRVAPDGAADRRDVPRRPRAQGDARRVRLPPAERARQPAAQVRGVRGARRSRCIYVSATPGDYELEKAEGRRRRAGHPPDGPHRSGDRGAPRRRARSTICSARSATRAAKNERVLVHHAHQAHGRGPHRLLPRARRPRPLPALRHRHARAHRHPARPAPRRVRRARRHQPAARGPRPARGLARRDPRRRQGGLPPQPALAHPDHRPRRAQRERPRHHVRRPRSRPR